MTLLPNSGKENYITPVLLFDIYNIYFIRNILSMNHNYKISIKHLQYMWMFSQKIQYTWYKLYFVFGGYFIFVPKILISYTLAL